MGTKTFGLNDYGSRSFLLTLAATMFSYLVDDPDTENGVKYAASEASGNGRGIIQQDGVAGQTYVLVQAGNSLVRKAVGAIAKGDPLTPSATPGALRTAKPGEPVVAYALEEALSADAYVPCALVSGGIGTVSRTMVLAVDEVAADGKLLTVPAGYRLDALIAKNETSNAVTMKAGKTSGTQTVIAPVEVAADGLKDCTLALQTFSLSADQDVYISSTDWNDAVLTVKAVLTYIM